MSLRPTRLLVLLGLVCAAVPSAATAGPTPDLSSLRGTWTGKFNAARTSPYNGSSSTGDMGFIFNDTVASRAAGTTIMSSTTPFPYSSTDPSGHGIALYGRAMYVSEAGEVLGVLIDPDESTSFFVVDGQGPIAPVGSPGRIDMSYASCGPASLRSADPAGERNQRYYEGALAIARPTAATTPDFPIQQYGYEGTHPDEESPLCDVARSHPALFDTSAPTSGPDTRRPSKTTVTCDGGPNPSDPFPCTVTVGDASANPGASVPTGIVDLTAPSPRISSPSCQLRAGSGVTATCTFTYTNSSVGAGQAVPVTASYRGDGAHSASSGKMTALLPPRPQPQPQPAPPVTCGDAPLQPCTGRVPTPTPVQTCVANVGGVCEFPGQKAAPIKVCAAQTSDCAGFTGGATFAGLLAPDAAAVEVDLGCPGAAPAARAAARQAPVPGTALGGMCRLRFTLTAQERYVYGEWSKVFKEEVRLRFDLYNAIARQPQVVYDHLDRFSLKELASKALNNSVAEHNGKVNAVNAMTAALGATGRSKIGVDTLVTLSTQATADTLRGWAIGPDGEQCYDPRFETFPVSAQMARGALAGTAGNAEPRAATGKKSTRPRRIHRRLPPTRGRKDGTITIASTPVVDVAPGTHKTASAKLTRFGRALLAAQARLGRASLPVGAVVSSTGGSYAPTTVSSPVTLRIKKPHRPATRHPRRSHHSAHGA